jgi:hypothetical protein
MEYGVEEIDTLFASLVRAARLGDYGDAARDLNRCLVLIQKMQTGMRRIPKPLLDKLNYSLETVFLMLKNKDWVAIADIVEYELVMIRREISSAIDAAGPVLHPRM